MAYGWNYSFMNSQLCSTNTWDMANLHWNQMLDHTAAMQGMHLYPSYNAGFYEYPNSSYMTTPMSSWGAPTWLQNMGWCGNTSNTNSNTNSSSDPVQDEYRIKFNKLSNIVKAIKDCSDLTSSEQSALDKASRNTKGTWEERFDALKEAYDEVKETLGEETIRRILAESGELSTRVDKDGRKAKESDLYGGLTQAGFEYQDTSTDSDLDKVFEAVKNLKSNNGTDPTVVSFVDNMKDLSNDQILDFISSWNTNYNDDSKSNRIIKHLKEHSGNLKGEQYKTFNSTILTPLVNALIARSNDFTKRNVDSVSYAKMEKAREELRESLNKSDKQIASDLSDKFDRLYVLTRKAAMAEINKDLANSYGDIDDMFNRDFLMDEVDEDLREEGCDISDSDVVVKKTRRGDDKGAKGKDKAKGTEDKTNGSTSSDTDVDAKTIGESVAKKLCSYTTKEDSEIIENDLNKLKKDNIMEFLTAYYSEAEYGGEGLIEKLDDDTDVSYATKKNLIDYTLEKAASLGLSDTREYKQLKKLLDEHEKIGTATDFNASYSGKFWSWLGLSTNYNEAIDEQLEALHKAMKAKI